MSDKITAIPMKIDESTVGQQQLAQELVDKARAEGLELVGPGGLFTGLTKTVLETALEAELGEHLGYDRHDPASRDGGNSRNGHRPKTVLTELGPVDIEVPRDRDGSFEPVIVEKRQRRLDSIDGDRVVADRPRPDDRRVRSALRGRLRRFGQQGHDLKDHRESGR
jgi:hypothetical protein